MKKIFSLTSIFTIALFYSQSKIDSLLKKYNTQKNIEKVETGTKIGQYYKEKSEFYNAIEYYQKAKDILPNLTIDNHKKNHLLAKINNSIGANYYYAGNLQKAMEYYIIAYKMEPKNVAFIDNLVSIFNSEENYEKGKYYNDIALKIATKNKDYSNLTKIWSSRSTYYEAKNDSVNAMKCYENSNFYAKKTQNFIELATNFTNIGDFKKDVFQKLKYYNLSFELWKKNAPNHLLAISNQISIARLYRDNSSNKAFLKKMNINTEEALSKAEILLKDAIKKCKAINHKGKNLQFSLESLSYVYELKKDYKNAYHNFQECVYIYDSLNSIENKNKILNQEASFNLEKKDTEISFNKKLVENQKKQNLYLIIFLILIVGIAALIYYQNLLRQKTNKKLQLLNTELDQANRIKTRFFGILNHDLRSPVANLIHFLHLQKENPEMLNQETKERLQNKTISGAENLLSSMEDILLWSKGQMENFKPQPKKITVEQLFEDNKKVFSGYHHITFEYHNPENIEFFTDENYLKTILRNLTSNSINVFSTTENPTIIWKAWQEKNKTYLSITDNGPGSEKEKFRALYDETEVVGIKSGLGLHLIRDLAKAINCEISVNSIQNEGTTFVISI